MNAIFHSKVTDILFDSRKNPTVITCARPLSQYLAHREEIDSAIKRVLESGSYILGNEVEQFEAEFASYIGVQSAVSVANGTEALALALKACDIGPGDEVITASHTAVATVSAIEQAGATPVLVDIDPDFYTIDATEVEAAISARTKAVIPVHLYGQPADIDTIVELARDRRIYVVEDCAQAHGARFTERRVGSFGDLACFSFFPTKNLGALGDGGMVVTRHERLAERVKLLRQYGWESRFISKEPGINSRLDELQAAVLRVKLQYLDSDNESRRSIADQYRGGLNDTDLILPKVRSGVTHVYHQFVVRSERRNELLEYLAKLDVSAGVHYPLAVHQQPAYQTNNVRCGNLGCTERLVPEILSLPIYPELSRSDVRKIIGSINEFFK